MMREVGAFEAKNKLGTLLDRVENGEEVIITRHGKAVARLIPNTAARDPKRWPLPAASVPGPQRSNVGRSIGKNGKPIAMKAVREPGA